ncbi:MAG: hypothetical protein IKK57_11515 [Clostridia bacterium]|nr:hypothetical protein [Clostridia bacterium]
MKKLILLLVCLLLAGAVAMADITWPQPVNQGQQQLQIYITMVNDVLAVTGGGQIDVLHMLTGRYADLGMDGIELPDDPFVQVDLPAEISLTLGDEGLHSITLRMQDPDRFILVAAACIHASSPNAISLDTATAIASAYAAVMLGDLQAAQSSPETAMTHSFEEEVNEIQGAQPRAYFAYYPNQYSDGRNWLQMTLVFARPGSAEASVIVPGSTPAPELEDGVWISQDNYNHFEIFVTPTPEPDSAAME